MKCDLCGMQYPPTGWTYYTVLLHKGYPIPNIVICSDCIDHLREIVEDKDGNIIGYKKALNLTGNNFSSERIIVKKNGEFEFVGD